MTAKDCHFGIFPTFAMTTQGIKLTCQLISK